MNYLIELFSIKKDKIQLDIESLTDKMENRLS